MASDERDELTEQLRILQRGEAAPWARDPSVTWWYPPLFGLVNAVLVLTLTHLEWPRSWVIVASLLGVNAIAALVSSRQRGGAPSGPMPPEFRRSTMLYLAAAVAAFALVVATYQLIGVWPAALVTLAASWTLMAWHQRLEVRSAAEVRARIA